MSDDIRAAITTSLFSPDAGGVAEKLLIHLKVFEDLKQGDASRGAGIMGKPRYLCLTQKRNRCRLYKTKRNQNGTFSIGKSWSLEDIRQAEVIDKNQFAVTLNKRYVWSVEKPPDKMVFLAYVVDACQRFLNRVPKLVNTDESYLLRFLAHRSAPPLVSPISSPAASQQQQQIPSPTYNPSNYDTESKSSQSNIQTTPPSSFSYPAPSSPSISSGAPSRVSTNISRAPTNQDTLKHSPISSPRSPSVVPEREESPRSMNYSTYDQKEKSRDERKEREKVREQRREKEKKEKESREEQVKQEKAIELQEKMTEQASMMNVEEILTDFNWKTSGNAAVLEKRLLGELHALEAANVHAIIQSDERVQSVVDRIDKALEDLDNMESWLSLYAAELNSMGDDIHEIETQNRGLQILTVNQNNLIKELDHVLTAISIPRESLDNLKYDPMETIDDIVEIQNSAEQLQRALKIKLPENLHELRAVQEMLETYNVYNNEFSTRIFDYLKSKYEHQSRVLMESKPPAQRKFAVAHPHEQVEDALIRYQGFSLWEKEMEPRMYNELQRHYASTMAPTYERDIREMVDVTRPYYSALRNRSLDDVDYLFRNDESRSARALAYGAKLGNVATGNVGGGGTGNESTRHRNILRVSLDGQPGTGGMDEDEKSASEAFSQLMNQCAMQVCRAQNFVCDLFEQSSFAPRSFLDRGPVYASIPDKSRLYSRREKIRDVKISKKVQHWMETIFESLEPSIVPLVEYGLKSDPTQAVNMMAAVEFQLEKWKESDQEFIFNFFDSLMLRVRRAFKQFVLDQIKIIDDSKVSSKKRRGILPSFRTFPLFVFRIEVSSAGAEAESQTRHIINDSYDKIIKSMMSSLDTNAKESDETGDDKEQLNANIMYIENMHHFYHALRSNRLPVLDKWVKEAKAKYESSLDAYIQVVIRRPLGKLLEFFDGVETLLRTSTPEEIAFHVNYNKSQLRKVIAMYPPKDVRKSLEQLYKRVDKHFSEEEGLLQVIWRSTQEELIRQHERMEGLISKCYPDAGVHLEFSIADVLAMMGDQTR